LFIIMCFGTTQGQEKTGQDWTALDRIAILIAILIAT